MMFGRKISILPRGRAAAGDSVVKLQLTSLVDMMVILVVFLLKSFSADGQLVAPAVGLELPTSTSQTPVTAGLVVEVGSEHVLVAGQMILVTASLATPDSTNVATLTAAMKDVGSADGRTPVLVQVDKRIEYSSLGQVLSACSLAGYIDVSLVVLGDES